MPRSIVLAVVAVCFALSVAGQSESAHAEYILPIDVTGMESRTVYGSPDNAIQLFQLSPNASIYDVRWEGVNYEAFAPSKRSEVAFALSNSDRSGFWMFNINRQDSPGTVVSASGGVGNMVLTDGGAFDVLADGILRFEVFELYRDLGVSPNAVLTSGTFSVTTSSTTAVPEPSLLGLAVLGGPLVLLRRRRR